MHAPMVCAYGACSLTKLHERTKARDVDSLKEWEKMNQRLEEHDGGVTQITVYADMKVIGNSCKLRRRGGDTSGDSDDEGRLSEEAPSVRQSCFFIKARILTWSVCAFLG